MLIEKKGVSMDWLALWILLSTWASVSGWCLSAVGALNPFGIILAYALFLGILVLFRSRLPLQSTLSARRIFRSRFLVPKIWLVLTILAFAGGLAYSPNNYDYLTYRFPRVLDWSAEHHWSWIATPNDRINFSGTGFEWLMVPLFILFKTDRLFVLINLVSYLFLPGLVFSVFTRLGISKRISWWWMWVLPCGYCYILQAGSVGNDSIAAVYFLASLHYLYQYRGRSLSFLAFALTTGVKASNLPLLLPWMVALFFRRHFLFEKGRLPLLGLVVILAGLASFLPTAALNIHFTGDFAGDPRNSKGMKLNNPAIGVLGNSLQFAVNNLEPPILPSEFDCARLLPPSLRSELESGFPLLELHTGQMQFEEMAGLGLGCVLFLGIFVVVGVKAMIFEPTLVVKRRLEGVAVGIAVAVALAFYMVKIGNPAGSRLVIPYYPLVVAATLILISLDGRAVHRGVFNWIGLIAMLSAVPLVVLSPARPLFPVYFVSQLVTKSSLPPSIIDRFNQVYSIYGRRADPYDELIALIPPDQTVIGFLAGSDTPEAPVWRPFGLRKVIDLRPDESLPEIKKQNISYVIVSNVALVYSYHTNLDILLSHWNGALVAQRTIVLKAHVGSEIFYLIRI
jgi:hypothetical protein